MKYIWEEDDIKDSWGRYVIPNIITDDGFHGLTQVLKIGGRGMPALISMGDGLYVNFRSLSKLLDYLNNENSGYRPVRKKELLDMISYNWDTHEGVSS